MVPLQMLSAVLFGCLIPVFTVIVQSTLLAVLSGLLSAGCIVWLVFSWKKCVQEELALCKAEYAYLWKTQFPAAEPFETADEESGVTYTVTEEGIRARFPFEGEQVFDEVTENECFIPWARTRLALATCNPYFTVKLALAVLDTGTLLMEADGEPSYEEPHILPLSEQLVCAVKSYGLEENMGEHWIYLLYNPDDAIKQIYQRGYIGVMSRE